MPRPADDPFVTHLERLLAAVHQLVPQLQLLAADISALLAILKPDR